MRISLLHATRGTPKRALQTRGVWLARAANPERVQHIFGFQRDDTESAIAFRRDGVTFVQTPPPPEWASSSVANWNAAAEVSTGDLLVVIADDLTPPKNWDRMLDACPAASQEYAVYAPDTVRDDGLFCHPIISRALYLKRGYIFHPWFFGVYCDNDFTFWIRSHGVTVYAVNELRWQHDHPCNKSRPTDKICELQNSAKAYEYGKRTLETIWPDTVPRFVNDTHSVWIGGGLGLMERLTLTLLMKHGHKPTLWAGEGFDRTTVPAGVTICEIPDDVLAPIRFAGAPHPTIHRGGIGSYAQWSDYFGLETLHRHGGLWVQLDIAITRPVIAPAYTFTTYSMGMTTCCFTAPKGSELLRHAAAHVGHMITEEMDGMDWHDTMRKVETIAANLRLPVASFEGLYDCGGLAMSPYNRPVGEPFAMYHWSNATHGTSKEHPVPGSEYERLCREVGLL